MFQSHEQSQVSRPLGKVDGQFPRAQKRKIGGHKKEHPQTLGPKGKLSMFEFESVFLVWGGLGLST
jgi:hypothetical protein